MLRERKFLVRCIEKATLS